MLIDFYLLKRSALFKSISAHSSALFQPTFMHKSVLFRSSTLSFWNPSWNTEFIRPPKIAFHSWCIYMGRDPFCTNPGRFALITCLPRKVSRFAPLNCYYIIIERWSLFRQFFGIIYLLVVCKKIITIHSFWSTLIIYVLVVYKQNNNSFILVYFSQRSQVKLFLQNLQKTTQKQ